MFCVNPEKLHFKLKSPNFPYKILINLALFNVKKGILVRLETKQTMDNDKIATMLPRPPFGFRLSVYVCLCSRNTVDCTGCHVHLTVDLQQQHETLHYAAERQRASSKSYPSPKIIVLPSLDQTTSFTISQN